MRHYARAEADPNCKSPRETHFSKAFGSVSPGTGRGDPVGGAGARAPLTYALQRFLADDETAAADGSVT